MGGNFLSTVLFERYELPMTREKQQTSCNFVEASMDRVTDSIQMLGKGQDFKSTPIKVKVLKRHFPKNKGFFSFNSTIFWACILVALLYFLHSYVHSTVIHLSCLKSSNIALAKGKWKTTDFKRHRVMAVKKYAKSRGKQYLVGWNEPMNSTAQMMPGQI